jgi:predicted metal-dependent hydrolase
MTDACAQPLPPQAREAIALFNAGDYYAQHDLLELLWAQTADPVRELYRAILQVGIAYYHIDGGNARGAHKMLRRALRWMETLPAVCQGVDVAGLKHDAEAALRELRRVEGDLGAFDRSLMRPVRLLP